MPRRSIDLLLLETVENLGIVGDIVKVRTGHARNYLLPMGIAEFPTEEKIETLKEARAKAQAELSRLRSDREALITRLQGTSLTITRSCNDQGVLYGSVTQRDVADVLIAEGFGVEIRAVRLPQSLRRIGEYPVVIQFDKDLRTEISLTVNPDQPLEERDEMEFDNEGNLIEKTPEEKAREKAERAAKRAAQKRAKEEAANAEAAAEAETADATG